MDDSARPLVLVVDDDPRSRELLRLLLGAEGYRVATAADGLAALEALRAAPPRVVLMDMIMPGMDGLELCRRLRRSAAGGRLGLVVVSGMDDDATRALAREAGADAVMTKPVNRSELRDCLAGLCTDG